MFSFLVSATRRRFYIFFSQNANASVHWLLSKLERGKTCRMFGFRNGRIARQPQITTQLQCNIKMKIILCPLDSKLDNFHDFRICLTCKGQYGMESPC